MRQSTKVNKIPVRKLNKFQRPSSESEHFKIRRIGDILQGVDLIHGLHRHDFFFILAVKSGRGKHEVDFADYKVTDHSVFILRPGQVHQLELKAGSTGLLLEFNAEFYHPKDQASGQRFRKAGHKNYCELETARFERLYSILESMFDEYTNREEGWLDLVKSNLEIFFIEFVRQGTGSNIEKATTHNYTQDRFEEFLELLGKKITTHKQVSTYTGLMNLSAYQLNEITKSSVGKTASELINDQILLEAKRHLMATTNQVKEIAGQLGYEDPSYFIRFFKKHTGLSPEAFRNSSK